MLTGALVGCCGQPARLRANGCPDGRGLARRWQAGCLLALVTVRGRLLHADANHRSDLLRTLAAELRTDIKELLQQTTVAGGPFGPAAGAP